MLLDRATAYAQSICHSRRISRISCPPPLGKRCFSSEGLPLPREIRQSSAGKSSNTSAFISRFNPLQEANSVPLIFVIKSQRFQDANRLRTSFNRTVLAATEQFRPQFGSNGNLSPRCPIIGRGTGHVNTCAKQRVERIRMAQVNTMRKSARKWGSTDSTKSTTSRRLAGRSLSRRAELAQYTLFTSRFARVTNCAAMKNQAV